MEKVDTFEEFIGLLSGLNQKKTPLMVNSFYIIDDEKQRGSSLYRTMKPLLWERQTWIFAVCIYTSSAASGCAGAVRSGK